MNLIANRSGHTSVHHNVAVLKAVDTTVFKVSAKNAADSNVLAHTEHPRPQTADATHE